MLVPSKVEGVVYLNCGLILQEATMPRKNLRQAFGRQSPKAYKHHKNGERAYESSRAGRSYEKIRRTVGRVISLEKLEMLLKKDQGRK